MAPSGSGGFNILPLAVFADEQHALPVATCLLLAGASTVERDVVWSPKAKGRLERVPIVVRHMARWGIERLARDNGFSEITLEAYEQARRKFGMRQ